MTQIAIPSDPFTRRLQKIGQLITAGDFPNAATELNAALKLFPTDPRIFLQGARLAEANGNFVRAEEAARKAVSLNPVWSVSVTELAALLSRLGRHDVAMEQAKKAVALDGKNANVLARAVDIAHQAQQIEVGLTWLQQLSALQPANAHYKSLIARDLRLLGDTAQALAVYTDMIAADPADRDGLLGRTQLAWAQGDLASALADSTALLALDSASDVFQFWHTLAQGATPPHMPTSVVQAIHDNEAATYDQHRLQGMNYQLPKLMAELIKARQTETTRHVLDLGCGTGLLGVFLGKEGGGALVGVELSGKMVEQAAKHSGLYDRFHTVNLLDALQATPEALYHVISACDVFAYVGDVTQAIPDAFRVLRPDGLLAFSCQLAGEDEAHWVMRSNLRFAHQRSHVEALCQAAGFDRVDVVETPLFHEAAGPVNGYIVVAHKPA